MIEALPFGGEARGRGWAANGQQRAADDEK